VGTAHSGLQPCSLSVASNSKGRRAPARMEYNLLEFIFVVIFFTALERGIDEKIFSQDKLDFLGNWAMLLFLVHKAVHMLFDSPYNWFVLLGLTFPCWMLHPAPKKDVRE
jgi:hypothetical protein